MRIRDLGPAQEDVTNQEKLVNFLSEFRCATAHQLLDVLGSRTSFGYRVLRIMKRRNLIRSVPLRRGGGPTSKQAFQLACDASPFSLSELQLSDVWLQARDDRWEWIAGEPYPRVRRNGQDLAVIPALESDDPHGQQGAIRVLTYCLETGCVAASYSDWDAKRAAAVGRMLAIRNASVAEHQRLTRFQTWRSFRDRPDPRF